MKEQFNYLKNSLIDQSPASPKWLKAMKYLFYPLTFLVIMGSVFTFQVVLSGEHAGETITDSFKHFSFFNAIGLTSDKKVKGEDRDRINILLLGMGGLGHDGPWLTDTMILASIKPSTHEVAMLSIPRDMSIPIPHYGWKKINSVNNFGELNDPGNGGAYTAEVLSGLLDQPIDYYVRVDFSGFEKLIDELGGIDVYVDKSFADSEYPDEARGYAPVSFQQGWQKMNGKTALSYARSRHGNNGEGSDFARSQRQQKVIKAVKDKALSLGTLLNIRKLAALYEAYRDHVNINMETWEMIRLAQIAKGIDNKDIHTLVLDDAPDGLLYATMINGAFLLLPKDQSFEDIQKVAANVFTPKEFLKPDEKPTVSIQNGTKIDGLASRTSSELKKYGYKVLSVSNAMERTYAKTVIYDLTSGQKPNALESLKEKLDANVTTVLPAWIEAQKDSLLASDADFLIVLGESANITKN